jgi:apolipoprotein D and lipocalin family protein
MKKKKQFLAASLVSAFVTACASSGTPLTAMDKEVNIPKFMGKWYVIANIPTIFESGAHNAIETYTWNSAENRIDIDFRFQKDSFTGPTKTMPQKGWIYNEKTKSEWRVQPLWPFKLAYLILDVAPDYSDTIIGVPSRKYVWIMARTAKISETRYQQLVQKITELGYDPKKLQLVPQQEQ